MAPFVLHLFRYVWLPAASFFAGVLNAIAGGGSFLSLPALIANTSAINAFYCFHARHGVDVGELLVTWRAPGRGGGRGGYRPFLHHITKGSPQPRRTVALKGAKKLPRILTPAEVQAVLDACVHLRDRFLFALLYDSGCRIGEALGLRHEDIDEAKCFEDLAVPGIRRIIVGVQRYRDAGLL